MIRKKCGKCSITKLTSEFYVYRGRPQSPCKSCRSNEQKNRLNKLKTTHVCAVCALPFVTSRSYQKTCSTKCRHQFELNKKYKSYSGKNRPTLTTCKSCGETYHFDKTHQKYCSKQCQELARKVRNKIWTKANREHINRLSRLRHNTIEAFCVICDKQFFKSNSSRRVTCGEVGCRRARAALNAKLWKDLQRQPFACRGCGKTFFRLSSTTACSGECKKLIRLRDHRKWRALNVQKGRANSIKQQRKDRAILKAAKALINEGKLVI